MSKNESKKGKAAAEELGRLERELAQHVLGQEDFLRGLLVALLADGHVLIEGVPGLGKTRAVNLLARACQVTFQRLQFTPDLLPADILGTRIYNQQSGNFETVRGPIFAQLILADEINRAPAKVQSALLETMQERQVTIGRESLALQPPFLVFATQNPIEQEGTYPLPEAQLDRFLLKLVVGYPSQGAEHRVVRMVMDETELPPVPRILDGGEILDLQRQVREVFIEDRLIRYVTDLVRASRDPSSVGLELDRYIELGASPRASIALARSARALAFLEGSDAVTPDHLRTMAPAVLRHRILRSYLADAERVSTDALVEQIVGAVPVP
jgi:MoxR-like ATPase